MNRIFWPLVIVCAIVLFADLAYHKHGHFGWEEWFGFHAFFGFGAFVFIVFAGKLLRKIVMRDEDYYGR